MNWVLTNEGRFHIRPLFAFMYTDCWISGFKTPIKEKPRGAHPLVSRSREGRQIPASRHVSVVEESKGSTHFLSSRVTAAGVATPQALFQPEFCNRCPENYVVKIHLIANNQ